jgi:hypothetical protein
MTQRKPRHKDLPFSPSHVKLLENVLDALDRLFDNESNVVDVYAIVFATAVAMVGTEMQQLLTSTADDLRQLIRTDFPGADMVRQQALAITDPLRKRIAALLPRPS